MKFALLVLALTSAACVMASPEPPCPADSSALAFFSDDDCSKYWECSNGIGYQFSCPTNLNWNPELLTCDYPESAGCTGFGWSTTTTPRPSPPTTTARTTPSTTRATTPTTTSTTKRPKTTPKPGPTTEAPGDDCRWWWWWAPWKCRRD